MGAGVCQVRKEVDLRDASASKNPISFFFSFGKNGYISTTKEIIAATREIARELATIPGIKIIGIPEVRTHQ